MHTVFVLLMIVISAIQKIETSKASRNKLNIFLAILMAKPMFGLA